MVHTKPGYLTKEQRKSTGKGHSSQGYIPEIDGLRALAVLAVIINHFNKDILPGGFLGVDIFFVISGFVITLSLHQKERADFKTFISGFYERRVKRILPALTTYSVIAGIAISLVNPNPGLSLKTGLFSILGFSNIYLGSISADYFDQASDLNIFAQTWSLGVEEQFYIFFPFLFWISCNATRKRSPVSLALPAGLLTLSSFLIFLYLSRANPSFAYYFSPARIWEISVGCLAFLALSNPRTRRYFPKANTPLLLFICLLLLFTPSELFILTVPCTTVLVVLLLGNPRNNQRFPNILACPPSIFIGKISYSLYLWHWGVLSFSRWTIGVDNYTTPILLILIFAAAYSSYRFIEMPSRRCTWKAFDFNTTTIAAFIAGSAVITLAALGGPARGLLYTSKFDAKEFTYTQIDLPCEMAGKHPTRDPLSCINRPTSGPTVFIFGNSHASNLVKPVRAASTMLGINKVLYLTNAIRHPALNGMSWNTHPAIDKKLKSTNSLDILIWSSSRIDNTKKEFELDTIQQLDYLATLSETTGAKVIIVDDLPSFESDHKFYPKFIFHNNGPSIPIETAIEARESHSELLLSYARKYANITYLDPFATVCTETSCNAVINGKLLYADSSPHFTSEGSLIMTKPIIDAIEASRR